MSISISSNISLSTGATVMLINAERLPLAERLKLFRALKADTLACANECLASLTDTSLRVFNASDDLELQLRDTVARFENRDKTDGNHIEAELPTIPWRARLHAFLFPQHEAASQVRCSNVVRADRRYQFKVELSSTKADIHFLHLLKGCLRSPSCKPSRARLKGNVLIISARNKDVATRAWQCANRLAFDKATPSRAICPLLLRPIWRLVPAAT